MADDALAEIWRCRFWHYTGLVAVIGLLAGWGYVVAPKDSLFAIWLILALVGSSLLVGIVTRQIRQARPETLPAGRPFYTKVPLLLVVLLIIGGAVCLFIVSRYPEPIRFDAGGYVMQGNDYAKNGYTPDAVRSPGWPLVVAAIIKLTGQEPPIDKLFGPPAQPPNLALQSLWLLQAGLLALTALIVYAIARQLWHKRTAWQWSGWTLGEPLALSAAALTIFCPFLIAYTSVPLTEIAATFWLTAAVYFWLKTLYYPRVALYYVLSATALVGAMQTRPTFIYLPIIMLIGIAVVRRGHGRIIGLGLVLVTLLLFLWPPASANLKYWNSLNPVIAGDLTTYQIVNGIYYQSLGALRYQTIYTPATPNPPDVPNAERLGNYIPIQTRTAPSPPLTLEERRQRAEAESRFFSTLYRDYVTSQPLQYAGIVAGRLWLMWQQNYVFPYYDPSYHDYRWLTDNLNRVYLIAGLVGLGAMFWAWGRRSWPILAALLYLVAVNAVVRIEFRYILSIYPVLMLLAVLGIERTIYAVQHWRNKGSPLILGGVGAALVLIVALSMLAPVIPAVNVSREKALDIIQQADDLNNIRQFQAAEPIYNRAITAYPNVADVWTSRGNYWAGRRDWAKAVPDYSQAIAVEADDLNAYRWRGDAYAALGQTDLARADYTTFLAQAAPANPNRNKVQQALQALKK